MRSGAVPAPALSIKRTEWNLPCLMTSDKNYLGEGNVDKFDALYFKLKQFAPDDQGENYLQGILALCKFHYCHFSKLS